MLQFVDQLGNSLLIKEVPKRIISLVPSQTEFLVDLGLQENLVGITKFCVHPTFLLNSVEQIGGTKKLNIKKIKQLNPDLIIGNKEENSEGDIKLLQKDFKVWMSDILDFDDAFGMMRSLAEIFKKKSEALVLLKSIELALLKTKGICAPERVLYFIWKDPYMVAANNTFIHEVLEHIGLVNAASHLTRYPQLSEKDLKSINPAYLFLSSEPFPFKNSHKSDLKKIFPYSKIFIVNGEAFSWYGSRLKHLETEVMKLVDSLNSNT